MPSNPCSKAAILAICDDTSAAVTRGHVMLSNVVASQTQLHKQYGGVFPTVAKLAHADNIQPTVTAALRRAGLTAADLSAVAVTIGPGLAPALEVGVRFAEEFAATHSLPLIPVNHLEGHLVSVLVEPHRRRPASEVNLPALLPALGLIVSGGHTQFVLIEEIGSYRVLGNTLDDAAGECLDKIGRMVNLGYPAGALIEELAREGDAKRIAFPLPLTHLKNFDLSFSGLKTFARNTLAEVGEAERLDPQFVRDFCASAQAGVFRHLLYKFERVLAAHPAMRSVWLGGGVAANVTLRRLLRQSMRAVADGSVPLLVPYAKKLCADNAAMIGVAANFHRNTAVIAGTDKLDRQPRLGL